MYVAVSLLCLLFICVGSSISTEDSSSYCGQLGCDQAGSFIQESYKFPMKEMAVVWQSKENISAAMNDANTNYGCVGSSKVVVCPFRDSMSTRHIMIDPATGTQYDTSTYDTLINVTLPILTEDNLIFAINSSHVSLVDPLNNRSHIASLPVQYTAGVHSPVYLPKLGFLVVFGNLSETQAIYKIEKDLLTGLPVLDLITTFSVAKDGHPCPWLPFTETTANGNRVYFFGAQRQEVFAFIAIDFMAATPYYKKIWEINNPLQFYATFQPKESEVDELNCTYIPPNTYESAIYPAADVNIQMLATPDNYIVMTTPITLLNIKDNGESANFTFFTILASHFLSLDMSTTKRGLPPFIWMSTWKEYSESSENITALNCSASYTSDNFLWAVNVSHPLGSDALNVTSRIASFPDPTSDLSQILVFGVSVKTANIDIPFHKKYCTECKVGTNKMLMAIRSSLADTANPSILWMSQLPSNDWEVRGQIIGVGDKLITLLTDGYSSGSIVAFG